MTAGLLALAAILLFCAARISEVNRWCRLFAIFGALGSLFVFGEEVSWGQRLFGLSTPEYWQSIDAQKEINLHNLWYFQGFRHLPMAAIGLVGLSLIAIPSRWRDKLPPFVDLLIPPRFLVISFLLMIATSIARESWLRAPESFGALARAAEHSEELGEFVVAATVLVYALCLLERFQRIAA